VTASTAKLPAPSSMVDIAIFLRSTWKIKKRWSTRTSAFCGAKAERAAKEAKAAARAAKVARAAKAARAAKVARAAKEAAADTSIMEEKERYGLITLPNLAEHFNVYDFSLCLFISLKNFVNREKEKERDYLERCVQMEVLQ